ncbi:hypothetical protein [Pseudomonas kuykendallii]|uniref:Uncharacterized protein n=1 Tax=Pseudomonas kuykendallii TaxID=1007099 RepID=A0A2W5D252_9PSED|nr:hypothetical protein [Pseudomonas kuykendallii]MCQ4272831.1 hypothetical protein [Pseudomonas kuykendallii]PZP22540.1 MAG: hypothetical protein DI599_14895 [Pseudomonas kuykendallii]SDX61151.1 hypothetical protein SAMN05216287_3281 [Pseudomonas kuykendallii]
MLGDHSEIIQHLNTARKHADQAETQDNPALYREAIDEMAMAIELLLRNSAEKEGEPYRGSDA